MNNSLKEKEAQTQNELKEVLDQNVECTNELEELKRNVQNKDNELAQALEASNIVKQEKESLEAEVKTLKEQMQQISAEKKAEIESEKVVENPQAEGEVQNEDTEAKENQKKHKQ